MSPLSNEGRGLKLSVHGNTGTTSRVSPLSNEGRGLKLLAAAYRGLSRGVSPLSNEGRGLKHRRDEPPHFK